MRLLITILGLLCLNSLGFSQATVFEEDFESTNTWTISGNISDNTWALNQCAGNGPTISGSSSIHITDGTTSGAPCESIEAGAYQYANASAGIDTTRIHNQVNASCASALILTFDYRLEGESGVDFARVVYSTDGGTTWIEVGGNLTTAASFQSETINLPTSLDESTFEIGFEFIFNDVTTTGVPLAIDNIKVIGTDNAPPTIAACPSSENVYATASCAAPIEDYAAAISATDNCTSVGDLIITQSPAANTTITQNVLVTITVGDESGNLSTCQFAANFIDTINPTVTCPSDQTIQINGNCQYTIPDVAVAANASDNCSVSGDISVSQVPPANGSIGTGVTTIIVTATDEAGNSAQCPVEITPIDNVAPTITCPDTTIVTNGTACTYDILDYTNLATVNDNCTNFGVSQSPVLGTTVDAGNNAITLTATDAGGNESSCNFVLRVIETEDPTITCPADIETCDPLVTYDDPIVADNCGATFSQIDNTGLSSGDIFPVGSTTILYEAIDSSGNTAQCFFRVDILEYDSPAIVLEDSILLCDVDGTLIQAENIVSGSGEWSIINGTGSITNQISPTSAINNLEVGITTLVWEVSSPTCGSNSDTITILVSEQAFPSTIAQDTIYSCYSSELNLTASDPIHGNGTWSSTNPNVSFNTPNNNVTDANLSEPGWYSFYWSVENGACPSQQDSVKVLFVEETNPAISQNEICLEDGVVELTSSDFSLGQSISWNVLIGGGVIQDPNNPNTTIEGLTNGTNEVEYVLSHSSCSDFVESFTIEVSLCGEFDPVIPTVITPNFDGKNDLFNIPLLHELYPGCEVVIFNRWGSAVFDSKGYPQAWDGTFKGEPVTMGTYFYRIVLNDEEGTVYKGDINVIH